MKFGKHIDELKIGDTASFSKTVSESDVYLFAGITGDFNPAHVDEEYARGTFFEGRIVHGILTAGFISTVIAGQLPGPGTIYSSQQLKFLAPVRMGDTLTARAEVKKKNHFREEQGHSENDMFHSRWHHCFGRRSGCKPS